MSSVSIDRRFRWKASATVILLTALALLLLGALRSEPVSLLFGGALTVLVMYVTLAGFAVSVRSARRLRRLEAPLGLRITPPELQPGGSARLEGHMDAGLPGMPGFLCFLGGELSGPGPRRLSWELPLPRRAGAVLEHPLSGPPRGLYRETRVVFRCRDLLGLTLAEVSLPLELQLRVLPELTDPELPPRRGAHVGGRRDVTRIRRRTDELLETRRYVPGDDLRTLNWKMYARWGELLVRIGEEAPPPRAVQRCLLHTGAPAAAGARHCDRLIGAFGGYCRALHHRGISAIADLPGGPGAASTSGIRLVDAGEEQLLLRELAALWWEIPEPGEGSETAEGTHAPDLRARGVTEAAVTVFAAPGAAGLQRMIDALRRRGVRVDLVLVLPGEDAGTGAGMPLWQRLLLQPPSSQPAELQPVPPASSRRGGDVASEAESPRGVRHVARV